MSQLSCLLNLKLALQAQHPPRRHPLLCSSVKASTLKRAATADGLPVVAYRPYYIHAHTFHIHAVNGCLYQRRAYATAPDKPSSNHLDASNRPSQTPGSSTANQPATRTPTLTWGQWIRSPEAIKKSVVHEFYHYFNGFKLLCLNVWSATKILSRLLKNKKITRRERELLVRTTSDLCRMVPFMIILVVPFMELALPFILKFFPNMLPSTFNTKSQRQDAIKKQLGLKIETARFLQDMLEEMHSGVVTESSELHEFLEKVRSGRGVTTDEFVRYAKIFRDELTLNSLQHKQLTAMCRLLNIKPFGNDVMLRMQLKNRVESLKRDDKCILDEGIHSLSLDELQRAVSARGMYAHTKNKKALRTRLQGWLDLSITKNVPTTLLILSRALTLTSRVTIEHTLSECISHLPTEVVDELEVRLGVKSLGRKADISFKLELLEQYSKLIEEEHQSAGAKSVPAGGEKENLVALANLASPIGLESLQIAELKKTVDNLEDELNYHVSMTERELKELEDELDAQKKKAYEQLLRTRDAKKHSKTNLTARAGERGKGADHPTDEVINDQGGECQMHPTDEEFEKDWDNKRKEATSKYLEIQKKHDLELANLHNLKSRINDLICELSIDVATAQKELKTFKVLDKNDDGLVSVDEVKFALLSLPQPLTEAQAQQVLDKLDIDHDGLIEVRHLVEVAVKMDIPIDEATVQEYKKRGVRAMQSSPANVAADDDKAKKIDEKKKADEKKKEQQQRVHTVG